MIYVYRFLYRCRSSIQVIRETLICYRIDSVYPSMFNSIYDVSVHIYIYIYIYTYYLMIFDRHFCEQYIPNGRVISKGNEAVFAINVY